MKILFFSYAYPNPTNPGLGTFNRTMIAGLANEHEVRVVSPVPFPDVWQAWSRGRLPNGLNDSKFQAVPNVPAEYCTWYYTPKMFRHRYGQFMQRSVGSTLNRVMQEFQPDIVLSYWTHPDGEVAVKAAHQFGIRAVTVVGGTDVLINARSGSRRKTILDVLHSADGVIAVSEDIKKVLVADGIPNKKVAVARRGIDGRLFHEGDRAESRSKLDLPGDRPILISVGRLVDVKGHRHLIDACRLLTERGVPFRCYLLGDGPLRSQLERQIEKLDLSKWIELRGSQTSEQLADWYRAADLSVLASSSEGVPNVLLESIACGTPFVASNVGGIPEIADPALDQLVSASNPVALADAMATQLAKVPAASRNSRRFLPITMSESAEHLSSILQSVQAGRSMLLTSDAIMHETMTETDLDACRPTALPVAAVSDFTQDENCVNDDESFVQFEDCFLLHELISSSSFAAESHHNSIATNIATYMNRVAAPESNLCAPANGCYGSLMSTKSPSSANTIKSMVSGIATDGGNHESFGSPSESADEAESSGTYRSTEPEFDELGRTGEGFYYEP